MCIFAVQERKRLLASDADDSTMAERPGVQSKQPRSAAAVAADAGTAAEPAPAAAVQQLHPGAAAAATAVPADAVSSVMASPAAAAGRLTFGGHNMWLRSQARSGGL